MSDMASALVYAPMRCAKHPVWKLTFDQKEELTARYLAGERVATLAAEFSIKSPAVHVIARRRGAPQRGFKRLPVNDAAFSTITPDSAYWIGFLMADGSVTDKKITKKVSLFLGDRDRSHLEAFRRFLDAEHKIITTTRKGVTCCSMTVTSARIVTDLAGYGVLPRKSLTAKCIGLEDNRDFWRGVVDGDGWLGNKVTRGRWSYPALSLCGSVYLMTQFAYFVGQGSAKNIPKVRRAGPIFTVQTNGPRAIEVARLLYDGAETALARKRALAIGMYSS